MNLPHVSGKIPKAKVIIFGQREHTPVPQPMALSFEFYFPVFEPALIFFEFSGAAGVILEDTPSMSCFCNSLIHAIFYDSVFVKFREKEGNSLQVRMLEDWLSGVKPSHVQGKNIGYPFVAGICPVNHVLYAQELSVSVQFAQKFVV